MAVVPCSILTRANIDANIANVVCLRKKPEYVSVKLSLGTVNRPVNLLDEFEHRWSYAIAFGAITNTLVDILVGGQYLDQNFSPIVTGTSTTSHASFHLSDSVIHCLTALKCIDLCIAVVPIYTFYQLLLLFFPDLPNDLFDFT